MAHKVSRDDDLIPELRKYVSAHPPHAELIRAIDRYRKATRVQLQPALRMILQVLEEAA